MRTLSIIIIISTIILSVSCGSKSGSGDKKQNDQDAKFTFIVDEGNKSIDVKIDEKLFTTYPYFILFLPCRE